MFSLNSWLYSASETRGKERKLAVKWGAGFYSMTLLRALLAQFGPCVRHFTATGTPPQEGLSVSHRDTVSLCHSSRHLTGTETKLQENQAIVS